MSTPDTNNIGIKLQAAGENLNTWGDPNLNNDLVVLSNMGSKWNPVTINGDTTISETNYSTTNDTEVATIDLVAGTVSAAFNLVWPSRDKRVLVRNSSGYTCTHKLSATSGFAHPTGRTVLLATDGSTDMVLMSPNFGGVTSPTSGSRDIPAWSAVETAIATASLPATAGTVLISGTDTTAGYVAAKATVNMGGLTTTQVSGLTSFQLSVQNSGAAEKLLMTMGQGYVGGFLNGGTQTAQFTPVAGTEYNCDCTSAGFTVNLSGMTTPQVGHSIKLNKFGNFPLFLLGTVNGQTNFPYLALGPAEFKYSSATWGWN